MKLFGLLGQKQTGKNLIAELIRELSEPNYTVNEIAFADGIKDSFCQLFGVTREFIEEWKENPKPPDGFSMTVRKALQFIGDGFRGIKETVWIDQAVKSVQSHDWWRSVHIFTDVRYINEIMTTKALGGKIVLIYRPGFLNTINHPSENQLLPILQYFLDNKISEGLVKLDDGPIGAKEVDCYLINEGTREELKEKIKKYIIPDIERK